MPKPKYERILIIRLSAMGDVALSIPVIRSFRNQFPEIEIAVLTRKNFNPLFNQLVNITLINPDFDNKHKGMIGLYRLFTHIRKTFNPEYIIDIHNVLRTKVLRTLFSSIGIKSSKIDKGRNEKRRLIRQNNKILKPLMHTTLRYAYCFQRPGVEFRFEFDDKLPIEVEIEKNAYNKRIGIAAFAKHPQKQYPLDLMKEVIAELISKGYHIYIFGGGMKEKEIAENMEKEFSSLTSMIGKHTFEEELVEIKKMNVMIVGDSANMHLAALMNTKIISIWGATHPYAGFTPYINPKLSTIVQNAELDCRPCSVYGNKPCYKHTMECMYSITPASIVQACEELIVK
jgi:ADP-heptose:LPS heptosyltransferase